MESVYYWLWLVMVFGAGNTRIWEVMKLAETAEAVYERLQSDPPTSLQGREKRAIKTVTLKQVDAILQQCEKKKIQVLCYNDDAYPEQLRHIYNPPSVLFYQGNLNLLREYPILTVVGTRRPSKYSIQVADSLVTSLAKSGFLIASGFAVGVDSIAHRAALFASRKTVAVMGCGLDVPYPKENAASKKYFIRYGLMLSEYLPGSRPDGWHFPVRNRILAGIGIGTLVIQAPERSGALITAEHAVEQGKPVFCVPPSNIFDKQCTGVVKYLREGAISVFDAEDIINEYNTIYEGRLQSVPMESAIVSDTSTEQLESQPVASKKKTVKGKTTTEKEKTETTVSFSYDAILQTLEGLSLRIMQLMIQHQLLHIDQIVQMLQADAEETAATLTELSIMQWIERLPGQYYKIK